MADHSIKHKASRSLNSGPKGKSWDNPVDVDSSISRRSSDDRPTSYDGIAVPLTFGIELEFFCAIHEKSYGEQHSWATINEDDKSHALDQDGYGPFKDKALETAARMLRRSGLEISARPNTHVVQDYTVWSMQRDGTADNPSYEIEGEYEYRYPEKLNGENTDEWQTCGLELVSRVFPAPVSRDHMRQHASFAEIERYISPLVSRPQDPWIINAHPEDCGFHVHVGIQSDVQGYDTIPLEVLQHLAFILTRYEGIISMLHDPSRLGYLDSSTQDMVSSNLMGLKGTGHICDKYSMPKLQKIQDEIFDREMTISELANLMDSNGGREANRFKFVSFHYTSGSAPAGRPKTIEFRQHAGTLDAKDITHWVCFIISLMRTAEERARLKTPPQSPTRPAIPRKHLTYPMRQGRKYKFRCTGQRDKLEELFELLELDRIARNYWLDRYEKYNPNAFTDKPWTDKCAWCGFAEMHMSITPRNARHSPEEFAELYNSDDEEGGAEGSRFSCYMMPGIECN